MGIVLALTLTLTFGSFLQEMRHNIAEELDRCEEELDREERYGGRRRSNDTVEFRETLAGYK